MADKMIVRAGEDDRGGGDRGGGGQQANFSTRPEGARGDDSRGDTMCHICRQDLGHMSVLAVHVQVAHGIRHPEEG